MTTDALGPEPSSMMFERPEGWPDDWPKLMQSLEYADYWRRRALAAEGLLRKSRRWRDHDPRCSDHPGNKCLCGLRDHEVSISTYFDSVKGEKP